jgi:cytochrome P450
VSVATRELAPGPRGSLLLGSAGEIRRDPLAVYTRLAREFGDVVRIRFILWPTYLVFHPDGVRHVLQEKHSNYTKDLYTYRMFKPLLGNGLFTNDGQSWLRQRRLVQPLFHRQRIAGFGEMINSVCAAMLESWEGPARRGEPINVLDEISHMTLRVAGLAFLRVDLRSEAQDFAEAFVVANKLLADYVYSPLPPLAVPSARNLRLRAARATLDRIVRGAIEERRGQAGDGDDMITMLLAVRDQETGEGMDDEQVRDEVMTMLFGGHDTTASALTWACALLARHEWAQDRARAEAASLERPRVEDLPRLSYIRMVLEESLRLYPPGWSFGRRALQDDEIGGYRIPAGSLVWVCPYVTHRHPAFWERPDEFDPERFMPEQAGSRPRFAYFPFSSGPRQCIGNQFAMMEAQLALAAILRRFRLRLAPGAQLKPEADVSLRPRSPVSLLLE